MPIRYTPPSPQDLRNLKDQLSYSGTQMADLFGLANASQWRKYSGDGAPREMSLPMLFLAVALQDTSATVEDVLEKCREIGAVIEFGQE